MFQFAGTLSDGLGKTMDSRHQSEREYIRYHGATSGEHLVAGIHGLAHGNSVTLFVLSIHLYVYVWIYLSIYPFIYGCICLSIHFYVYLSIHPSIYIYLSIDLSVCQGSSAA